MLACPRCGAAVPEASVSCAYCAAPLLLKSCPACLARVFLGHKFCPGCGETLAAAPGVRPARGCPRCHATMVARVLEDLTLDDCNGCGGTYVDRVALELLLDERRAARAESVLGAYDPGGDEPLPIPSGAFYVKCPDCANLMNRKQFAVGAKVIVDVCKDHGTWFDAHELARIVRFVKSGGLARAEQLTLDQEREKLRQERIALKTAQLEPSTAPPRHHHGGLLVDLLSALLR